MGLVYRRLDALRGSKFGRPRVEIFGVLAIQWVRVGQARVLADPRPIELVVSMKL
jgi:hypothetical protein